MGHTKLSVFLCLLLRHQPELLGLEMDKHGWVTVEALISAVNRSGRYRITKELLDDIVATDEKGRYRYSEDGLRIKASQGHSIPWVEPELQWLPPPARLYHGTTVPAYCSVMADGAISKMKRHAVHMQQEVSKAWQSAKRWNKPAAVLVIDASAMAQDGYPFGRADNGVWCTESVPVKYICEVLYADAAQDIEK